jgi:hypothetical protein
MSLLATALDRARFTLGQLARRVSEACPDGPPVIDSFRVETVGDTIRLTFMLTPYEGRAFTLPGPVAHQLSDDLLTAAVRAARKR